MPLPLPHRLPPLLRVQSSRRASSRGAGADPSRSPLALGSPSSKPGSGGMTTSMSGLELSSSAFSAHNPMAADK